MYASSLGYGPAPPYHVFPDGQRFLIAQAVGDPTEQPITVITNWTSIAQ